MTNDGERAALTGELSQVPLWDILQTLQVWPTPGCIDVDGAQELATIQFHQGKIVGARCGLRRGEAAVYRALRLRRGRFTVRRTAAPRDARLSLPITGAILEGVRRHDECERLRASLPGEHEILSWPSFRVPIDLRGDALDAAELFLVPRTIDDAIRASGADELSLLHVLGTFASRLASRPVPDFVKSVATSPVASSASSPFPEVTLPSAPARRPVAPVPPPLRDDYELVAVEEPDEAEALVEQSTFEPFTYEPEQPAETSAANPGHPSRNMPPRMLAALASAATLATFVVTMAVLPSRPAALSSLAPEVARWMQEAWCEEPNPPHTTADFCVSQSK